MKHVLEDAINPNRREALRAALADLEELGENPFGHNIRTVRAGEEITCQVLGHDNRFASLVTEQGIVVADRADLPETLPDDEDITFTARSDFSRATREQPTQSQSQPQPATQPQQDDNPELKAIEAKMAAQRSRDRDDDDNRGRPHTSHRLVGSRVYPYPEAPTLCALPFRWMIDGWREGL